MNTKHIRKTLSILSDIRKLKSEVFRLLIGYIHVSTDSDRQSTNLQRNALISAGIVERNIFEDKASAAKDDRVGLAQALAYVKSGGTLVV